MEKMDTKKKMSRMERECFTLYRNALLVHIVLTVLFFVWEIPYLAFFFALGAAMYLTGSIMILLKHDISFWVMLSAFEFVATAFLGNVILGWGYGFSFHAMMLVPMLYYFIYLDKTKKGMESLALGVTIADLLVVVVSCVIGGAANKVPDVPQQAIGILFVGNAVICASALIGYCHDFILEMNLQSSSLINKDKELYDRINYDALTKVYKRDYFFEKAQEMILSNPEVTYCMICTDIKDFKLINDLYGKEIADNLLVREADEIRRYFSKDAVYGRLSADKFAFCVPKEMMWEADFLRMADSIKGMFRKSSYQLQIYAGVYEMQDIKESMSVACDKANIAIASIKGDYQRMIAYYTQDFLQNELARKQVISEFDVALKKNQFCIFLQPQTMGDGTAHGAEALVRWYHPTKGLVMPGSFIDYLEQAGVIYKLDAYVWEQAAYRLSEWKKIGREDLHISVNISTKDFYYMDIYQTIMNLVKKYDIAPRNLRLEITETALATNFSEILEVVNKLQDEGFIIEIDDFGSGYSSFNMLKDFRADVLKIDREFLNETENKKRSRTILEGIISLSVKMKMDVITEGVETREQVDMLTDMGCGMFQGYYFSKPISVQEFEQKYIGM